MPEPAPAGTTSSNRGVMIVLSYLWILALVPLLVEKEDQDVQWHAKHGIVLMVAEIVFWIVFNIVVYMIPFGCVVGLIGPLIAMGFLAVHVVAIIKGLNGQRLIIPGAVGVRQQVLTAVGPIDPRRAHRGGVRARLRRGAPAGSPGERARRDRRHSRLPAHDIARPRWRPAPCAASRRRAAATRKWSSRATGSSEEDGRR